MNLKHFLGICAALPLMFVGCTPEEEVTPAVPVISAEDITVSADAHTDKLSYTIENPMEGSQIQAESNQDWIHSFNYDTPNVITFEVDANISDSRTAELTLSYATAETITVTVTQMAAGESIALDPEVLSFLPDGGDLEVTVNSGRAWIMTGSSDWVTPSIETGDPGAKVVFTAQANESDEPREAEFDFICGTNKVTLSVTQSYAGRIIVEQSEYNIPGTANTFTIGLQSNMSEVSVEITEGADWLTDITTKAMESMSFEFSATENEGEEGRSAIVVFSNADASEQVKINQESSYPSDVLTRVEDENLKKFLKENFDTNGDGKISKDEALAVTDIVYSGTNLISAAGIEYFENVEILDLNSNSMLTSLNASELTKLRVLNLNGCSNISEINLEGSNALEELNIGLCSKLTSVDLKEKSALKYLSAYSSGLTSLDVTGCPLLESLTIYGVSTISSIDLSNNTELLSLSVQNISDLDISNCTKLESLTINSDSMSEIDLSNNTALRSLSFSYCTFSSIDNSMCPDLQSLSFSYCDHLSSVDISKNMKLNSLTFFMCSAIEVVYMTEGQYVPNINGIYEDMIIYRDMEYPTDLLVNVTDENLKKAIINMCDYFEPWDVITEEEIPYAKYLDASGRGIKSLTGLDYLTELVEIDASDNEITEVDISTLQKLEVLNLSNNQVSEIDFSRNPNIKELYLDHNQLTAIEDFPTSNIIIADLSHNNLTSLSTDYAMSLTTLDVSYNQLNDLSVHYDTVLTDFDCSNNQINDLNIWSLDALVNFNCSNNPLPQLSQTTYLVNLETLNVSLTDLVTLDLTQNTKLRQLIATGCDSLTDIYVGDNDIQDMQVDSGVNIIEGAPAE